MRPPAQFAALLSEGRSYAEIADLLGCHRDTVVKWEALPEVQAAVATIERQVIRTTARRLLQLQKTAVDTLEDVQGIEEASAAGARVRAAEAVLNRTGFPQVESHQVSGGLALDLEGVPEEQLEREILQAAVEVLRERGALELAAAVAALSEVEV